MSPLFGLVLGTALVTTFPIFEVLPGVPDRLRIHENSIRMRLVRRSFFASSDFQHFASDFKSFFLFPEASSLTFHRQGRRIHAFLQKSVFAVLETIAASV